jgi:ParB family chromosome partitioning protein
MSGDDTELLSSASGSVVSVPVESLQPNPNQPRQEFRQESLRELADSIQEKGIIQPIIAEETEHGRYTIIAGERRYRAACMAGLKEVPVLLRTFSEEEKLEIALIENVQREDLSPVEEAKAYRGLMEHAGLSQEEVAKRVGKNRSTVANSLRLLKLPDDMQAALASEELTAGHARAILSVVNPADQRILFNRIVAKGLSVREAETLAAELNRGLRPSERKESIPKKQYPELMEIEQKFIDLLGTKVSVKGSVKKGRIEISYYSMDDLERIIEILNK